MPSVVPKGIGGTLGYAPSGVSIEMAGPSRFRTTALWYAITNSQRDAFWTMLGTIH